MPNDKPEGPVNEYQTGGWKAHWILIVCTLLYVFNYMDRPGANGSHAAHENRPGSE